MLLLFPNAQFTAERVKLELDHPDAVLSDKKLAAGLLLFVNRPEITMQPFVESRGELGGSGGVSHTVGEEGESGGRFWYPNAKYEVMVCDDPFPAVAQGPGLALASDHYPILARGTMTLPLNIFSDYTQLNREDFKDDERVTQRMSVGMNWEDKSAWRAVVMDRLAKEDANVRGKEEEYFCSREPRVDGKFNDGRDISRPVDPGWKRVAGDEDVRAAGYN